MEPNNASISAITAPAERADQVFLEGPRSRFAEFFTLLRVMRDFLRGFRTLHFVGPCVTIFGSARVKPDDPHYELARKMGSAIAQLGFTVMTGGGPGIMEAANRGAKDAGGRSVGCTIELLSEEPANAYLDRCVRLHYFFVRKALLVKYSYAFVASSLNQAVDLQWRLCQTLAYCGRCLPQAPLQHCSLTDCRQLLAPLCRESGKNEKGASNAAKD